MEKRQIKLPSYEKGKTKSIKISKDETRAPLFGSLLKRMPELNYCLNIVKNYAGGYTTIDATSYERGKTKITASEQSTKNKDEKRKNSKREHEKGGRAPIFYILYISRSKRRTDNP